MKTNDLSSRRLTGIRREVKYLIDAEAGARVLSKLQERIPPKLVNGAPSSYRVSVYLDTADREFSKTELEADQLRTKMRVRDYYLLSDDSSPVFGPSCFVEVKIRFGQMVEKSRFEVAREAVPATLTRGPELSSDPAVRPVHQAFEATRQGKPLDPLFVVHYRRYTLQDETRVRITFDDMVSYHVARREMLDTSTCTRRDLPPPLLVEPHWIVEVKSLGAAPAWVEEILDVNRQSGYSKFGTGVRELERRGMLFPIP
jgi:hypothetical protein